MFHSLAQASQRVTSIFIEMLEQDRTCCINLFRIIGIVLFIQGSVVIGFNQERVTSPLSEKSTNDVKDFNFLCKLCKRFSAGIVVQDLLRSVCCALWVAQAIVVIANLEQNCMHSNACTAMPAQQCLRRHCCAGNRKGNSSRSKLISLPL